MRYEVVTRRSVGNGPEVVVARTRRENGAVNEAEGFIASARENAVKHNPDGYVVEGPTHRPNEWSVASVFPDGQTVYETVTVRAVAR